jgi:adenosylmethionine-8-amino-7-oxononanoate aminotransferase
MAPFNGASSEMAALRRTLLERGLFVSTHWHTVLIPPLLIITEEQLAEGFRLIDGVLKITDAAVVA